MRIFALSDLHLSFGTHKSMEVFRGWENYTDRIRTNWNRLVEEEDIVVLAGDLSWGTYLEDTETDFRFIDKLKGQKILIKGNHDYWWSTVRKMENFFREKQFNTLHLLHNNCFETENFSICGTRGWCYDASGENDELVLARECGRLKTSLQAGLQSGKQILTFLHYPPVYADEICQPILDVLKEYDVHDVYYGHIHGSGRNHTVKSLDGIQFHLISCDSVDFTPVFIA